MTKIYRPTIDDMTGNGKWQALSLKDAGQFDKKFATYKDGAVTSRVHTTGWSKVSTRRAVSGVSRKARIRASKESAS